MGMPHEDSAQGFVIGPPRPPPGQYHFETRAPTIYIFNSICLAIMLLATGIRIAIRFKSCKLRFGPDDWVIMLASVSNTVHPRWLGMRLMISSSYSLECILALPWPVSHSEELANICTT